MVLKKYTEYKFRVRRNITFIFALFKEDILLPEGHPSVSPLFLNIQWFAFSANFAVSLKLI